MQITLREEGVFQVVSIVGEVDMHSSGKSRKAILDCLNEKSPVLVDLSGVSYMDSSGVANLVEGFQQAKKLGLFFGLVAVPRPVAAVLKLARLDKVFPMFASSEEAAAHG